MASHNIAVIGTGDPEATGYAMAYHHAHAYDQLDGCELVASADIVPRNAERFAEEHGIGAEGVFEDHRAMLAETQPDVVSVTVPPMVHAEIVIDCIRAPSVRAIHCEKPMAYRWGDSRLMAQEAIRHDVILAFNHQRRFAKPFREAKRLLDAGDIGELQRVECEIGGGLFFDYGSHSIDLCNYFNDEIPPAWVIGQVDYREENRVFGAHNANQVSTRWQYLNGVHGSATAGFEGAIGAHNRLVGTGGVIEVGPADAEATLRIRRDGADWETIDTDGEGLHGWTYLDRAVADTIQALDDGYEPELCANNALNATEIIFATYESARRRGRVDCPLTIEDNPLVDMVERGDLLADATVESVEDS